VKYKIKNKGQNVKYATIETKEQKHINKALKENYE